MNFKAIKNKDYYSENVLQSQRLWKVRMFSMLWQLFGAFGALGGSAMRKKMTVSSLENPLKPSPFHSFYYLLL